MEKKWVMASRPANVPNTNSQKWRKGENPQKKIPPLKREKQHKKVKVGGLKITPKDNFLHPKH
jgi:hypothetical protein